MIHHLHGATLPVAGGARTNYELQVGWQAGNAQWEAKHPTREAVMKLHYFWLAGIYEVEKNGCRREEWFSGGNPVEYPPSADIVMVNAAAWSFSVRAMRGGQGGPHVVSWFIAHVGGWWLVVGGWWLVVGGWWLVVGGWWLVGCSGARSRAKRMRRTWRGS